MVMIPNAIPANIRPNANFAGLDGWRSPIICQMKAKTGARAITNIAGTDCHQLEGNDQPNTALRVSRSANSVMLDPACSYVIQKITEKTTRIKITSTRLSSSPFNNLVVPPRYPTKYPHTVQNGTETQPASYLYPKNAPINAPTIERMIVIASKPPPAFAVTCFSGLDRKSTRLN